MGLITNIGQYFERSDALAREMVAQSYQEQLEKDEKDARDLATRLLAWYHRDRTEIVKYIKTQAALNFDSEDLQEWQVPLWNGVPRTIRRLSITYKTPPDRQFTKGGKPLPADDEQLERIDKMFAPMGGLKGLDQKWRQIEPYVTLLNTAHFEIVRRREGIDWDLHLRPAVTVTPDPEDYLEMIRFAWSTSFMNPKRPNDAPVEGWFIWTPAAHFFLRADGYAFPALGEDTTDNPYAADVETIKAFAAHPIPIVTLRKTESDEYWGRYGADIVDAFEQANIQLANLWQTVFLQTHGQPIGTNLGLAKEKRPGAKIPTGPKHPFLADGVTKDDVPPSLEFASPDPKVESVQGLVDWFIRGAGGSSYGLPPSAWAQDEKVLSGFAKMVDNLELLEQREEDTIKYIRAEETAWQWSRYIYNRTAAAGDRIDEDIELHVRFRAVEFPEAPLEQGQLAIVEQSAGGGSPVDYLMRKHKLASREEAMELALIIAKENQQLQRIRFRPRERAQTEGDGGRRQPPQEQPPEEQPPEEPQEQPPNAGGNQ